jgi:hypothetical protein
LGWRPPELPLADRKKNEGNIIKLNGNEFLLIKHLPGLTLAVKRETSEGWVKDE